MRRFILSFIYLMFIFQLCWSQDGWKVRANLPAPRYGAVAFSIGNFGYIGTGSSGSYEKNFWKYDPTLNQWESIASMPTLARYGAFAFAINGYGYVGGGTNEKDASDWEFWKYDPDNNVWSRMADLPTPGNMQTLTSFAVDGKGYYLATYHADNFFEYDPEANTWIKRMNFPGVGKLDQIGFSIGGKGYIGSGFAGSEYGGNTPEFWEYDPLLDCWSKKASVPGTPRTHAVGFGTKTRGYIGLGVVKGGTRLNDFWEYNPETDSWYQIEHCGYDALDAVGMCIGTKGYVGTGMSQTDREFWEYTPIQTYVDGIDLSQCLKIYPNPVKEVLNIESIEPVALSYSIFAVHGQLVMQGTLNGYSISVSDLPAGPYIITMITANKRVSKEFIKK